MKQELKKITNKDKKWIDGYLKQHFGCDAIFNYDERLIKVYDNNILTQPEFLDLLSKFKVTILPSLY